LKKPLTGSQADEGPTFINTITTILIILYKYGVLLCIADNKRGSKVRKIGGKSAVPAMPASQPHEILASD
jgi:hypothetical protein